MLVCSSCSYLFLFSFSKCVAHYTSGVEAEVDNGDSYISYDERDVRRSLLKGGINRLIVFISHA